MESVHVVEDRTIPGPACQIPIRIYRPQPDSKQPLSALVYYHGEQLLPGKLWPKPKDVPEALSCPMPNCCPSHAILRESHQSLAAHSCFHWAAALLSVLYWRTPRRAYHSANFWMRTDRLYHAEWCRQQVADLVWSPDMHVGCSCLVW